jgi:hypothetical protein
MRVSPFPDLHLGFFVERRECHFGVSRPKVEDMRGIGPCGGAFCWRFRKLDSVSQLTGRTLNGGNGFRMEGTVADFVFVIVTGIFGRMDVWLFAGFVGLKIWQKSEI